MTLHVAIACVSSKRGGSARVKDVSEDINAFALYTGVRTGGKGDLGNQVAARAAKNPSWFSKQARRGAASAARAALRRDATRARSSRAC